MTTALAIIVAIVLLVALSKIFTKDGLSSKVARKPKGSSPGKKIEEQPEEAESGPSISSHISVKGASLFRPPPEPALFTGRKEAQKKIVGQITTFPAIIGISGHSGVGKTCMAISLSNKFASQFTTNCLFVDMQGDNQDPPSAENIMRRIILRFHPSQPLPTDDKKLAKLYRTALKTRKGILILDNASNAKQVKPLAPPPSWLLIVTSTEPVLIPKMVAILLDPMDHLEAQTLLTRWAPKISPAIKEICNICKGVPMALEIIGKLFIINSTMTPDYFAKKFVETREGFGGEDENNFVVGIRAAISFSYHMLPEQTALVLKKLSVFPESFTAGAVSFVCEDPKCLSLIGLEKYGLVQHNANTNRFYLHQQVKNFVRPLLAPGDRNMTERRLATEFMNVLESAHFHVAKGDKEAIKGFRLFDLELENIKAGMEWSRRHCAKDNDAAQICSGYAENGATMISQRLSPAECVRWFEAALTAARQLKDKEAERKHLLNLGRQYVLLKQSEKATRSLQSALEFCKSEGDVEGQKTALQQLTLLSLSNNDHPLAIKYIEESLELDSGDPETKFELLTQLTKCCTQNQEHDKAISAGEEAMELDTVNNDKSLLITLFHNLGKSYMETGEEEKSLETFESALELCREIPGFPLNGELIKLTSEAACKAGDVPRALKHLLSGLEMARKTNDLSNEGALLIQLAETHIQNKSEDQAFGYLEMALNLTKRTKDRPTGGRVLWMWSQALAKSGNLAVAVSQGLEALKIYEDLKKPEASEIRAQINKWSGG